MNTEEPVTAGIDAGAGRFAISAGKAGRATASAHAGYVRAGVSQKIDLLLNAKVSERDVADGHVMEATGGNDDLRTTFTLKSFSGKPYVELHATVRSLSGSPITVKDVVLASAPFENLTTKSTAPADCRFWGDFHDVWSRIGSTPLTGPASQFDLASPFAYHAAAVYSPKDDWCVTFLYRLPAGFRDIVEYKDGAVSAYEPVDTTLEPGETIESDYLRIAIYRPYPAMLEEMHDGFHVARRAVTEVPQHFGWNTWEAFHEKINEEIILETLADIEEIPWLKKALRYIILDGGWQGGGTGFLRNHDVKFPHGMDFIATKIREAGFVPGIWTAPFHVSHGATVAVEHPDWLLRDGDELVGAEGNTYYLDVTHPEAREYIYSIYEKLYGWGYRYYKTDYLVNGIKCYMLGRGDYRPGVNYHDPKLGPIRGMRLCMEGIRRAIREDSFWLGCGTDIGSAAGLVDASRTGGDIGPFWTRVSNSARAVIHNSHMHGKLFLADPDFSIVKGSETFKPEFLDVPLVSNQPFKVDAWEGGPCFNARDAKTWATNVILSGGMVTLTDRIRGLNELGLDIIHTIFRYAGGKAARPIDIDRPIPGILLREWESGYLLGLVNWDNDETIVLTASASQGIDFPKTGVVTDVWTGEPVPIINGGISRTLGPHDSLLVYWK